MSRSIDEYWALYQAEYGFESVLKVYRERRILEILDLYSPRNILEIGPGFEPSFVKHQDFESFVLIEPGQAPFNHVAALSAHDGRIRALHGRFEEACKDVKGLTFDFIILPGLLHEVDDANDFLKQLLSVTTEQTVAYINVPNANSLHRLLGQAMGVVSSVDEMTDRNILLEQKEVFSLERLLSLVSEAWPKSQTLDSGSFFLKPFTHSQMMSMTDSGELNEEVFDALYAVSNLFPNFGAELFGVFRVQGP